MFVVEGNRLSQTVCLARCCWLKLEFMVEKDIFNKILKVFQLFYTSRKLRKMAIDVILY